MAATHEISEDFKNALLNGGILHPFLRAVRDDDTLLLGLRGEYVSIYYRGGQLLKLGSGDGAYRVKFDPNYGAEGLAARLQRRVGSGIELLDRTIKSLGDAEAVVDIFGELKGVMDVHPKIRSGHEREFQQLVARENNRTRSAGASSYFITDIEHASGKARFDMLGVRWGNDERKRGDGLLPVLFEMKYGESALEGSAGIVKHLKDIFENLKESGFREKLRANVEAHFNQLHELGLLEFNRSKAISRFTTRRDRVQVVFVLAGYNPRSTRLGKVLEDVGKFMSEWGGKDVLGIEVDLRFFHSCFCGYAMHDETMLEFHEFRELVDSWRRSGNRRSGTRSGQEDSNGIKG